MIKLNPVKKLEQTRFGSSDSPILSERENSYSTVIACFMGMSDAEEAFQIQEHFPEYGNERNISWVLAFSKWLEDKGYDWGGLEDHQYDDSLYIVFGVSYRGDSHACIYKNGQLWHDPHPDGSGLLQEVFFEFIEPVSVILQ